MKDSLDQETVEMTLPRRPGRPSLGIDEAERKRRNQAAYRERVRQRGLNLARPLLESLCFYVDADKAEQLRQRYQNDRVLFFSAPEYRFAGQSDAVLLELRERLLESVRRLSVELDARGIE